MKSIIASGKRKTAIARAALKPGTGVIRVNNTLLETLEPEFCRMKIREPLILAGDSAANVDIEVKVTGGGTNSQSEAARLAVAKVLVQHNKKLHKEFLAYDRQLLVADVRQKETHKPRCHGKARSKEQKSYR